jgi:hypothetical protein
VPHASAKKVKFIMDENLTFKNDGNLSLEEAATVGVGALVSLSATKINNRTLMKNRLLRLGLFEG